MISIIEILTIVGYVLLNTATLPQYKTLYREKKSDQFSIIYLFMIILGLLFIFPSILFSPLIYVIVGLAMTIGMDAVLLIEVLYYKKYPGGRVKLRHNHPEWSQCSCYCPKH